MSQEILNHPLVAIVGSTGTGKSQLGVDLARRFNGEIVNADALQMYEGLPIITNKIPEKDCQGIRHHLLGNIGLGDDTWQVGIFVKHARQCIRDIRSRGKLPIVLGGTHYYIQALIFNDMLSDPESPELESATQRRISIEELQERHPILQKSPDEIYEFLKEVDPDMASRRRKDDTRKVRRCLEIYLATGRKASELWEEQQAHKRTFIPYLPHSNLESPEITKDEVDKTEPFPPLILWLHAPTELLAERLNARVHTMLESGLEEEVLELDAHALSSASPPDRTRGIYIAIGYKEFTSISNAGESLRGDDSGGDEDKGDLTESAKPIASNQRSNAVTLRGFDQVHKAKAIEQMQAHTRQYAARQLQWLRKKFFPAVHASKCDTTFFVLTSPTPPTPSAWAENVTYPAEQLLGDYLARKSLPDATEIGAKDVIQKLRTGVGTAENDRGWLRKHCSVCNLDTLFKDDWEAHLKSRKHRRAVRGAKKEEERDKWFALQRSKASEQDSCLQNRETGYDDREAASLGSS